MVRLHPHPPRRGSSVVEQRSEEPRVDSSILSLGTKKHCVSSGVFCFLSVIFFTFQHVLL